MMFTFLFALAELASAETREPILRALQELERTQPAPRLPPPVGPQPMAPLRNPRTGVTCTMRILNAEPMDPESVRPAPEPGVDPHILGKGVSPCVE